MDLNVEILIKGVGNLDIDSKMSEAFGIPLTFNISDIKDISKRKASFSKTIKILGSKNNNKIFNHIYEIKGQSFDFDMTRKHECVLLVNKNPVMNGFLVLKSIDKLLIGSKYEVVYSINIFSEVKNFFDILSNKKLNELDFSSGFTFTGSTTKIKYDIGDHQLNPNLIADSANSYPTYQNIYTYPIIDYGYYILGETFPYTSIDSAIIYPSIFQKAILDKMFYDVDYRYVSKYFDSSSYGGFFGNMLNIYNKQNEFRNVDFAEYTSNGSVFIDTNVETYKNIDLGRNSCQIGSYWTNYYELSPHYLIEKELSIKGDRDTAWGFDVPVDGDYKIVFRVDVINDISGTLEPHIPAPTEIPVIGSYYDIMKFKIGDEEEPIVIKRYQPDDMKANTGLTSTQYSWTFEGDSDHELVLGDFVYLRITPKTYGKYYSGIDKYISENVNVTLRGTSLEMIYQKNLDDIYSGVTYDGSQDIKINKMLPEMSQADWLKNHIKMANLYIWNDKEDDKRLHIEPREDFYKAGSLLNWTDKVDYNKGVTVKSLNDSIANIIRFEHTPGKDFYSEQYLSNYDETYGNKIIDLDNFYLKENQLVKIDYQSYLMRNSQDYLYPILYDNENSKQKWFNDRLTFQPLVGFINQLPTYILGTNPIKMANYKNLGIRNTNIHKMPWATHAKVMGGLSFDMNYETTGQTFTLNSYDNERGLYKIFWENYINNITDDDSRMVTYYINLSLEDILNLDFRNRILIDGQVYFLEKIEYDVTSLKSSKVTLLKEIDPIEEGGFNTSFILKNDSGDYIITNKSGDRIYNEFP